MYAVKYDYHTEYIIQILTGRTWNITFRWTAKSYIFPRDYIFPKCAALRENIVPRENITILAPPTRDISSVPVDICYIRWSKWMISSKLYVLYDPTKFGNKTRSLRTKQNWTHTWQLARVLLWRSIVNQCVLSESAYPVHFFLGQFPNMELMLLLLSPLFYLLNCYIFVIASLRLL